MTCSSPTVLALAGLLAVFPVAAGAVTLHVPADHPTIQGAVDAASPGDVIQVAAGGHAPFTVDGKTDLIIKGQGSPSVNGGGAFADVVTIANSSGITLDGLVIENSGARGLLIADSTNVTVRRCAIRDTASDGIRAWGSSDLLIEKNTIDDTGGDGIDFSDEALSGPTSDSVIQKNALSRNQTGIDLDGDGNRVEKNTIEDSRDDAIGLDETATNAVIAKNRITNPNTAMLLQGSGHRVEKNRVQGTNNEGIIVLCTLSRIEKNKLDGVDDDAIDLEADDNEIVSNSIKNTGDNGIEMGPADGDPFPVTGNLLEKNKIASSGGHGIDIAVGVGGNTLRRNKASKSDGFDLFSEADEDENVFEANKFGTVSFP